MKILMCSGITHPVYTAGIIQIHTCHHTARLQNRSWSLDKVDTARLLRSQCHHHLHHLNNKGQVNKTNRHKWHKSQNPIHRIFCYLNLCISFPCKNMISILNHVLQQFASRGRA